MQIGIIGNGVVGSALAAAFSAKHNVNCWDSNPARCTSDLYSTLGSDLVFVCVPEVALDDFFSVVGTRSRVNFVIKSTCAIGTTHRLASQFCLVNIVHSPEFLTARTAVEDARDPKVSFIGHTTFSAPCSNLLRRFYETTYLGKPIIELPCEETEALKIIQNSFFAVKVAFFNEVRSLCDGFNLNWDAVRLGLLADGRINPLHTLVPGPDGKRGFGGTCLEKDLLQMIHALKISDHSAVVTEAALRRNYNDRKKS